MAIVYSYPIATPELQDLLVGIEKPLVGGEDQPRTRNFTVQSIISLAASGSATNTVTNVTSTALSLATLNSTYPSATVGFRVQCPNGSVLKTYEKTSTGWISYTITNVA